jgi:hypothetical protein
MHSVPFSAFSVHYRQCTSCPWRHENTGCNALAGELAPTAIFRARIGTRSRQNRSKRWESWNIVVSYISYDLLQTKGETCAKFGSDPFRTVDLYKVQTNIQTNKQTFIFTNIRFIGPCKLIHSCSATTKMHLLSPITYSCKTLYIFRTVFQSIIRSSKLRIQQWPMSNSCCYLLLSAAVWHIPLLYTQFRAPDDGRKDRPKHVERFTRINNLR